MLESYMTMFNELTPKSRACEFSSAGPSCRVASQFTKVLYSNPHCETQHEDPLRNMMVSIQIMETASVASSA
jgi:hypothetical protein